jgi:hypothetical protein
MGYAHYFPGLRATSEVITDARKIIAASGVTVCGPNGQGLPAMNEADGIRLNGFGAAGEAYETFHLRGTRDPKYPGMFEFCKTEQRPYDEVVTAILIAAAVRSEGPLRSDGQWDNWAAGVELFERAVRPLTEDERIGLEPDVESMRPEAQ